MALPPLTSDIGRVLGGRYRLRAPVGTGASARVYVADDITLRRQVAVKMLHEGLAGDEAFLRRFRAEAQAAASLNHPHVLAVFDWGHDDVPYLVTEFLAGGSLRSMLDAGHRLTPSQALLVGLEAAKGLEYAHAQGLVHRDIKPANLLFDDSGRLRIADFGLARALAEAGTTEHDGTLVGTARYASPEQARGERVGPAGDVYALALALDEAVSGQVPFASDTRVSSLMARVDTPLDPSAELGPLQGPVRRAGAVDPDERPDASTFAADLMAAASGLRRPAPLPLVGCEATIDDQPVVVAPTRHGARRGGSPQAVATSAPLDDPPRRRWPWVLLSLLAVAGAGVAGVSAWVSSQPTRFAVPDLAGLTEAEAQARVIDFGWVFDPVIDVREPGTEPGEVVRTEPPAGTELEEGATFQLYVSLGEPLVGVPQLDGLILDDAALVIEERGLEVGEIRSVDDEEVPAGVVLEVDLLSGVTELEPGSEVPLVVSAGPADRSVPAVPADGSLENALAAIAAERLVAVQMEDFSPDVPAGEVMFLRPSSGAIVPADSEVEVWVSKGPEPVEVPNVIGLSVTTAIGELEDLGFVVRVSGPTNRLVLGTDPLAGEIHRFGSEVVVITEAS